MTSHPGPGMFLLQHWKSHVPGTPSVQGTLAWLVALSPMFGFLADTGAMAVLALTCVKRSIINGQIKASEMDLKHINNYTESLVKKILHEKKENGLIGNVFSTGEAMQVSQRLTQETERGVMEESNTSVLSYWPAKILVSILFPILTLISLTSPSLPEMYSPYLHSSHFQSQCFDETFFDNFFKKF